ncbi:DUF167 domain-containing protein [Algiphilus aromaticivorans]|uniref:DUF167 domain-containing protein n=1 Tax=Algiphilus aromaticivorans TaxID=382454 RepID=UPI000A002DDF|nr:DUF167 family protein [Algiphilus aromaticivorans]
MRRSAHLEIKVAAGASKNRLLGWMGPVLKLSVTAAPEKGRANRAACALLAEALDVPAQAVSVQRGATAPRKRVAVEGIDDDTLRTRLAAALSQATVS